MSIKWSETKKTEIQGLNYVQGVVNDVGCIFNKVDGTNDIGLDGYIEFTHENSPTGLCVGIQVKAGNSHISANGNTITIKADRNHFEYWYNHILPVIAVVYIPQEEKAYWIDITQYLSNDEDIIETGPYSIKIDRSNVFSADNFKLVHYQLRKYLSSYGEDKFFGRALKFLADLDNPEKRYDAVRSLFSFHRDKLETWHYLVSSFCFEDDVKMQVALIYAYRHVLLHGDIWWHPGNVIDSMTTDKANRLISKYFGFNEVSKLMDHIDEGGMSRGTVGFDVNLILRLVPGRIEFLKKIILDPETSDDKRFWSGICLINEFQENDHQRAIYFAESMQNNFPNSIHADRFTDIKNTLIDFQYVDFCG
ncbi:DUF4365 domain-containing protein [Pedobacter suwonensis]|uniref:DUF4365 domain-containing protein n=1 Tax=Pedobacter suwonensis TaxID=332999 RepID=UPI0036A93A39